MLHILLCFLIIAIIISSKKTIKSLDGGGSYLYQMVLLDVLIAKKDLARNIILIWHLWVNLLNVLIVNNKWFVRVILI